MALGNGNKILIERQNNLGAAIKQAGLAGVALNAGATLTYLTGLHFHLSEAPAVGLFTPQAAPIFILREVEVPKTEVLAFEHKVFSYADDPATWGAVFEAGARGAGLDGEKIGVEPNTLRLLELRLLEAAMPEAEFVPAGELTATLRMQKDDQEIQYMREAAVIAQKALEKTLQKFKLGMTEREVSAEIVLQLYKHGSGTTLPFQPIVSSGPNGANPHASPSERKLAEGDLVVIDWGASVEGYFSDITRTFAVGKVEEAYAKIHQIVKDANAAARAIVKPGVTCAAVDKAARDVIDKAGYGEYFIHRTGHGLGMETHEEPYMHSNNELKLKTGMTFTIEPGIYLPGKGGVRIEDDVVATEDGMESFSDMPRGMSKIG